MGKIIASYPRSGSTWLRFILCNYYYHDIEHTFETVNKHIPTIESDKEMNESIKSPMFYKTHQKRSGDVLHLVRHVGDCLVSEYYYHKKFLGYEKSLSEFVIENEFGKVWRETTEWYFGYEYMKYEEIPHVVLSGLEGREAAITKSEFARMQGIENSNPFNDNPIKFVREGRSGQWQPYDWADRLIETNKRVLKLYGYL